jgi:hypothetical protein
MWKFIIFLIPTYLSRRRMIAQREYFFNAILEVCSSTADAASVVMGQDSYNTPADMESAIVDHVKGQLIFTIPAEYYGLKCYHTYSLWQIGNIFKVGLLLGNGLEQAPLLDWTGEMSNLWHGVPFHTIEKGESTLYEWVFDVPKLYDGWSEQEMYVLGMNHCRQRVLRIIHDYALLKKSSN